MCGGGRGEGEGRGGEEEGGGGGADGMYGARVCPRTPTTLQLKKKMDLCQCTDPFGWTDQPAPTMPVPSESKFQERMAQT